MAKKITKTDFIEKSQLVHGSKYDYSNVEYISTNIKVCIICPEHGEFWQEPRHHINGHGCPKCSKSYKMSTEDFVKKAQEVHDNKYDYSKVEYKNNSTKVCIICPEHGEFWQIPSVHLRGCGCPKCKCESISKNKQYILNDFIEKANKIHLNKYDYSKTMYKGCNEKVCIICPTHGEFWQTPKHHLSGHGCIKCSIEKNVLNQRLTNKNFIGKAIKIHGSKYDYSKTIYGVNNKEKVCIMCPKHGKFWQTPDCHLQGQGCPKCANTQSTAEDEIIALLSQLTTNQRERKILDSKEIDIYIPSLKLGIEYNGLRWHSEQFGKDKYYHIDKLNECNEKGINLIQIFEDEWVNHREICESKLKQICGLNHNLPKMVARKCTVREITNNEAKPFLNANHIQGFVSATVYLGCYNSDDQLVGVMQFKKEHEDGHWDLNRFATDIRYHCVGVGGKLFKYFTEHYDYKRIKSFADRRWTTNPNDNLYTKLGFEFVEFTKPDYRYYNGSKCERYHKFGFRKQILNKKYGLPLTMTEYEMTKELGFYRIWDCGLIKYEYMV